jgi:hypothetical protein
MAKSPGQANTLHFKLVLPDVVAVPILQTFYIFKPLVFRVSLGLQP